MRLRDSVLVCIVCASLIVRPTTVVSQDLGHKLPGLIGLDAGKIPPPGLYLIDRVVNYEADELRDRNGNLIPIGKVELLGFSNAMGFSYTTTLPSKTVSLTFTAAAPIARLRTNVHDRPEASFDRFGLADIYVQPLRVGWRGDQFDLVGSYAFYIPTGTAPLAGGKGVSSGQITHQFSVGNTLYASQNRSSFVTALASYDLNLRKRDIDMTRGDTFQIQGGVGLNRFNQFVEFGLAGYALWQVRDDRGNDLPVLLQSARDRVYGAGPEAAVRLDSIRSQIRFRYEWDVAVRSRPKGNVLVVGFNFAASRR